MTDTRENQTGVVCSKFPSRKLVTGWIAVYPIQYGFCSAGVYLSNAVYLTSLCISCQKLLDRQSLRSYFAIENPLKLPFDLEMARVKPYSKPSGRFAKGKSHSRSLEVWFWYNSWHITLNRACSEKWLQRSNFPARRTIQFYYRKCFSAVCDRFHIVGLHRKLFPKSGWLSMDSPSRNISITKNSSLESEENIKNHRQTTDI